MSRRIAVDGPDDPNEREGDYELQLALSDLPGNDDFADAVSLGSASQTSLEAHNRGATQEPGEPIHGEGPCDPSVWYSWTAPPTSDVTLSTADSEILPLLGIYTGGSVGSLTRVPSTRTTATYDREVRTFRATAGATYKIAVDSGCGQMSDFRLALASQALPADPPGDPSPPPQPSEPQPGPHRCHLRRPSHRRRLARRSTWPRPFRHSGCDAPCAAEPEGRSPAVGSAGCG